MNFSNVNYSEILLDEICLEGLEGITPESLWERLSIRLKCRVIESLKPNLWKIITCLDDIEFYELPEPRETIQIVNRFENPDHTNVNFAHIYPLHIIKTDFGSCKHFATRKKVSDEARSISYELLAERWNRTLVIVGNVECRWNSIAPGISFSIRADLTPLHYCILETLGRSRYNGELTVGEYSLSALENDKKKMFYLRKSLILNKLITKQVIPIQISKPTLAILCQLPRFYNVCPYYSTRRFELVEEYMKSRAGEIVIFKDLLQYLLKHLDKKSLKILRKSQTFRKRVVIDTKTRYREMYPNAPESQWKIKSSGFERLLATVKLLDNEPNLEDLDENDEDETNTNENMGSVVIGESLIHQAYTCIQKAGTKGISKKQLSMKMGTDLLTSRMASSFLCGCDLVGVVIVDFGKQKTQRLFSYEFKDKVIQEYEEVQNKIKLHFDKNDSISNSLFENSTLCVDHVDEVPESNHEITSEETTEKIKTLEKFEYTLNQSLENKTTPLSLRKLQRIHMIMEQLQEKLVIPEIADLVKFIAAKEALTSAGAGLIHKKSLCRLLYRLEKEGQLKIIRKKVVMKSSHAMLKFVCQPHIDQNHPYIQSIVDQTKTRLMIKRRMKVQAESKTNRIKVNDKTHIGKLYGFVPKFARMRLAHEFLFYLVYGHQNSEIPLSAEIQSVVETLDCADDMPVAYENTLEKCTFVPPLNCYIDYPHGWVMLSDALIRFPLCIFTKLINVKYNIQGLADYLKHPIKSQLLIKHLPETMQNELMQSHQHISCFYEMLVRLCFVGLIQFGRQPKKSKHSVFFYVNRNASLWDTTTSRAGYHKVEEKDYPREDFKFENTNDVKMYWNRMNSICINTLLGERYAALGEQVEVQSPKIKMAYALNEVSVEEVEEKDCGNIPGDGCGAAGFDSLLYSHLKRSWTPVNLASTHGIKPIKRKLLERNNIMLNCPRKKPLLARGQNHKQVSISKPRKKRYGVRTLAPRKRPNVKDRIKVDDVDKQALNILGSSKRCTWNIAEDQILFLAKIANYFMNPMGRPSFYPNVLVSLYPIVRDILHTCTFSYEKTSSACQRRLQFILRNPQTSRNVELSIAEIRRCYPIYQKYYDLHTRLHIKKNTLHIEEYKIHFVELIHLLYRRIYEKVKDQNTVILPDTLTEVYQNFVMEAPTISLHESQTPRPYSIVELRSGVLSAIIHSSLGSLLVKDSKNFFLLQTYRTFPENILRSTLHKLKTSGMISRKKLGEVKSDRMKTESEKPIISTHHFKLSIIYNHRLAGTLHYKFYSQAYEYLKLLLNDEDSKYLNGGSSAILLDLLYMNKIELELNIPENVVALEPQFSNVEQDTIDNLETACDDIQSSASLNNAQAVKEESASSNDMYIVNSCQLIKHKKETMTDVMQILPQKNTVTVYKAILESIFYSNGEETDMMEISCCNVELKKAVFNFIDLKKHMGATIEDMKTYFLQNNGITKQGLLEIMQDMVCANVIRRVGNEKVRWISKNYLTHWFIKAIPSIDIHKKESDEISDAINSYNEKKNSKVTDVEMDSDIQISEDSEDITHDTRMKTRKQKRSNDDDSSNVPAKKRRGNDVTSDLAQDTSIADLNDQVDQINRTYTEVSVTDLVDIDINIDCQLDPCPYFEMEKNCIKCSSHSGKFEKTTEYVDEALNGVYSGKNVLVSPRPWIRPDGSLNFAFYCRWIGAVLNHLLFHPISKFVDLQKRFNYMQPFHLRLLLEVTEQIGCIRFIIIKKKRSTLFSTMSSEPVIENATGMEDDVELCVEVLENAFTKFSIFKGEKDKP